MSFLSRFNPRTKLALLSFVLLSASALPFGSAVAQDSDSKSDSKSIESFTEGMQKLDGFFTLYWDDAKGTLWMEIDRLDEEILHMGGLAAGLGSNDIGLDRGQLGGSRIVAFSRVGPKILMTQPYR